jgi:soluble lytic murein transglycosylase-like protein
MPRKLPLILLLALGPPGLAPAAAGTALRAPAAASADLPADRCVAAAASYHRVSRTLLRAVLQIESAMQPGAINRNRNGTLDLGIGQLNSVHLPELASYGIRPVDLLDACTGTYVAAWHLARQQARHGNNWFAVGAYHSETPMFNQRYQVLVYNQLVRMGARVGPALPVPPLGRALIAPKSAQTPPPLAAGSAILAQPEFQP